MAFEPLHRDINDVIRRVAGIEDSSNILVVQIASHLRFTLKKVNDIPVAEREVGQENFECNPTINPELVRAVDGPHAADAHEGINAVFITEGAADEVIRVFE
jgi:hypothetical protein